MALDISTNIDRMSSMNLKATELLKEVQLDYSPPLTKAVDKFVSAVKEAISNIPEDILVTPDLAPGFVKDIGADKVEFKFKRPTNIQIGGSYAYRCVAKPDVNVDLFVRLPKQCFHEKDYMNYRYHAKRCLYLCIIKNYLKGCSLAQKVVWSTFQNEVRKPILIVYPATKHVEIPCFSIRIIPTAKSLFAVSKLNLERNNVRALNQEETVQATPAYNSSILEDMFLEDNDEVIRRTFLGWKELGEALILLKVWARQRSSIYAHDCLNGFLISVLMAYLATEADSKLINHSMDIMQIFRVTIHFITNSKYWKNGLFFKSKGEYNVSKEERMKYLQTFPVVIADAFAPYNIAFRMTTVGWLELQDEAALSLSCINKCRDGGFDEIFMTKIDFAAKYDHCIRLDLKGHAEVYALGFCLDDECWRLYEQKVHSVLKQGLGNRAKVIRVAWINTASEFNIEDGLSIFDREPMVIGISISSTEEAFKKLVRGPTAENKDEALKFQKFWGEKAELRAFRDGTIAECIEWNCEPSREHLIIKSITEYILVRHISLSKEKILHIVDQLDFSLLNGNIDPTSSYGNLLVAFDALSNRLRLLDDIPLKVSSVQPLDPAFRCTSVCPPQPHPLAYENGVDVRVKTHSSTCIQPLEVMIQLEGSGNWPMDVVAIEKTKSAFLLRIGESLQNKWGMACTATEDNVDVFMSGYAFRLKILHERGLSLVKKQSGIDQAKRVSSTDRDIFLWGQHSSMINGLQKRYPMYGPVVRLAKRWIAAHLLSGLLVEEAVELLVAYLFVKPLPFCAPGSRITGFLRFLRLLSEYDWTYSALIVDISGDFTLDDEKEIHDNFNLSRKAGEGGTKSICSSMFLATAYDKASEAWTRSSPSFSELRRLAAYASSSEKLLTKLMLQDQLHSYRWECLYRTPLNNYDAVILLHRDKLANPQHLLFPSEVKQGKLVVRGNSSKIFNPFMLPGVMKGSLDVEKGKLMVDFDPLRCFVKDLQQEFPNMFKVWYDSLGSDAIGLTWERTGLRKRTRDDMDVGATDLLQALRAVGEVGKGLVRSIHFLKAPRLSD